MYVLALLWRCCHALSEMLLAGDRAGASGRPLRCAHPIEEGLLADRPALLVRGHDCICDSIPAGHGETTLCLEI